MKLNRDGILIDDKNKVAYQAARSCLTCYNRGIVKEVINTKTKETKTRTCGCIRKIDISKLSEEDQGYIKKRLEGNHVKAKT